jgi:hypothetical protein
MSQGAIEKIDPRKAAEWLVVGFCKCWSWEQLAAALHDSQRAINRAEMPGTHL